MEKEGIPNGKLRPIGAPTYESRIISRSLNNLTYLLFADKMLSFQHGYRKGKGTHTALSKVWEEIFIKKNKFIYEFDFRSFFNRVDPTWVHTFLRTRSWELADLVVKCISLIEYKFDRSINKLPEEGEIS